MIRLYKFWIAQYAAHASLAQPNQCLGIYGPALCMHCRFRTGLAGHLLWQRLGFRFWHGRFRCLNIERNSRRWRRLRRRRDGISQSHAAFEHRCQYSHAGANPEDTPSIAKGRTGHRRGHDETFLSRPIAPECHSSMPVHFMFLECQNENTVAETFPLKTSPPIWFPLFLPFQNCKRCHRRFALLIRLSQIN